MNHSAKAVLAALALFLLAVNGVFAQGETKQYDPKKYRKEPVWIDMMNDPDANYFETIKAFREFWRGYKLPGEPAELENFDQFEVEVGLEPASPIKRDAKEEEKEKEREQKVRKGPNYAFEVKRFRGWIRDTKPWVQENGHILSEAERQAILDKQQKDLKEEEAKQKH